MAPRGATDYNKFVKMRCDELKLAEPTTTHRERFARAAAEWKSLTDATRAAAIERAVAYYDANPKPEKHVKPAKAAKAAKRGKKAAADPEAPARQKRAPTDFNRYMRVKLAMLKEEQAHLTHRERFTMAAAEWSAMDAEARAEFLAANTDA